MEDSLKQLWFVCIWFFGISTTVTLCLFGWLMRINSKIGIGDSIKEKIETIGKDLCEVKVALKGDYEKKGLVTRHYDLERRVQTLENSS